MVRSPRTRPVVVMTVALALAASVAGSPVAAETTETPSAAVERDLKPVRGQVRNMERKVEEGVIDIVSHDDDELPLATGWAADCCLRNLRALRKRVDRLEQTASGLQLLYRKAGRQDGAAVATELLSDVRILREQLVGFAAAPDESAAAAALRGVVAAVVNLNKVLKSLKACCDDLPVPAEG